MNRSIITFKARISYVLAPKTLYVLDAVDDDGTSKDVRQRKNVQLLQGRTRLTGQRQKRTPVLLELRVLQCEVQHRSLQHFVLFPASKEPGIKTAKVLGYKINKLTTAMHLHMPALVQRIRECSPQDIVTIEDAPGGLHGRVQEAVASATVPQDEHPRAETSRDLHRPIQSRRRRLQLLLGVSIEQLVVELLLYGDRQLLNLGG